MRGPAGSMDAEVAEVAEVAVVPLREQTVVLSETTQMAMKAPMKVDRAFCEPSSLMTSVNVRGVAVLAAEAYAETIDATAKVAMTRKLRALTSQIERLIETALTPGRQGRACGVRAADSGALRRSRGDEAGSRRVVQAQ